MMQNLYKVQSGTTIKYKEAEGELFHFKMRKDQTETTPLFLTKATQVTNGWMIAHSIWKENCPETAKLMMKQGYIYGFWIHDVWKPEDDLVEVVNSLLNPNVLL